MNIDDLLLSLESIGIAERLREGMYLFPFIESIHVVAFATVFGLTLIMDLRMLGMASTHRPFDRIESDILKWVWGAFAVTAASGALMFTTNAVIYYHNFYFRTKMLLLLLAGINVLVFELTTKRSAHTWGELRVAPLGGRIAAVVSLTVWIGVIFMGRWIGFTTAQVDAPADETEINDIMDELNFDDLFGGEDNPLGGFGTEEAPPDEAPPAQ